MKQVFILLIILLGIVSCNENENISENKLPYCENERLLLSSFDTIKVLNYKLFEIQDSLKEKLEASYNEDFCSKDLRFNAYFEIDSINKIPLSLNCYYSCDDCNFFIRERNDCIILLNLHGQVAFEGELSSLDSISKDLFKYYTEVGNNVNYPESYKKVQILILWDFEVKQKKFKKFIKEIIVAYMKFANKLSVNTYGIAICKLNKSQLLALSKKIPFNLRIGILEIIEIEDELEDELEIDTIETNKDIEIIENLED